MRSFPTTAFIHVEDPAAALFEVGGLGVLERNVRLLIKKGFEVTLTCAEEDRVRLESAAAGWHVLLQSTAFADRFEAPCLLVAGDCQYGLSFFSSVAHSIKNNPHQSRDFFSIKDDFLPVHWRVKDSLPVRTQLSLPCEFFHVGSLLQSRPATVVRHTLSQGLFSEIEKQTEGLIARSINKKISFRITPWLLRMSLTPNVISVMCFAIGLAGCLCLLSGSLGMRSLGALLVQFNSILDGCDGEVARIKVLTSHVGAWMDTIFDDVMNNIMFVCLYVGYFFEHPSDTLFKFCVLTTFASLGVSFFIYHYLVNHGTAHAGQYRLSWDREKQNSSKSPAQACFGFVKQALKRDFFIFLAMILIILNLRLPLILLFSVVWGAFFLYLASFIHNILYRTDNEQHTLS